jgi:Ca-activated chloride channel family protein
MRYCVSNGRSVSSRPLPSPSGAIIAALFCFSTVGVAAQAPQTAPQKPTATAQHQANPALQFDPRKPETQPNLTVDRDPVPSPDPEPLAETPGPNTPGTTAKGNEIEKGQNGVYTLHENVDEVLLNCTVIDDKGHPVEGLTQADFRVWEDNIPQRVSSFRHQDQPVSIGLLIDNSGSMRDKRTAINNAVLNLMRESNRQDTAFVVNFNDRAYLDQGFTTDLVALNRGLSHFDSHGYTALYDAVAASADELAKAAKYPKQVLLIVSDGADNASHLTEQKAIQRVQDLGGPVVYSIGLLYDADQREYQKAHEALQTLSDDTGGIAYFPSSLEEVNTIASDVARDIRNQYTIGYHSTKPSSQGGFRVVHVEAYGKKGTKLSVRTRRGYYAKPVTPDQKAEQSTPKQP